MTRGKRIISKLLFAVIFYLLSGLYSNVACSADIWFRNYTINDGLSGNFVECIIQDSRGYLWIGTRDGLNLYDGYSFKNVKGANYSNFITSLFEDKNGNIWIGSLSRGVTIFNFKENIFYDLKFDESINADFKKVSVWQIVSDHNGSVWLATTEGLLRYSEKLEKVTEAYFNNGNGKYSQYIKCLAVDNNHNLWIGTDDNGLKKFDALNNEFIEFRNDLNNKNAISSNQITTLYFPNDSLLWIGTIDKGINILNINTLKNRHISITDKAGNKVSGYNTTAFLKNSKNSMWICTENQGLKLYDEQSGKMSSYYTKDYDPSSIQSNSIKCILEDSFGIVWIGSRGKGVISFYPKNFGFRLHQHVPFEANSASVNNTRTFCEDKNKNIWVGTDGGGIDIYDFNLNKIKNINSSNAHFQFESNVALSIVKDKEDNIWIGTWGDGLIKFNQKTKRYVQYKNDPKNSHSIASNFIMNLHCDKENNLWISCFKEGLNYLPSHSENFNRLIVSNSNSTATDTYHITSIFKDSNNCLWMGTMGNGIFIKNGDLYYSFTFSEKNPHSLTSNIINAVFEDSKNRIWIATSNKLNLFNKEQNNFTHYGIENGFINESIYDIREDDSNNLWMSTNNGIIRFNPETGNVDNYDFRYRIMESQFNANTGIKLSDNRILFGGLNGFNSFNPMNIKTIKSTPILQLTDFLLFNKSQIPNEKNSPLKTHIANTKEIKLKHKQKVFTIEYVGIDYYNPEGIQYAYKLEDFDENWNYVGSKRSATYTNLKPGNYTFKLKAKNSDTDWTYSKSSLVIEISPPFWKTPIAFIIYFITIFQLLIILRTLTIKREQEKSAFQFEKYKLKKSEELDLLRMRFFTNISHDLKTPLTLILAPIEQLLKIEKDEAKIYQFKNIHRNASRLLKLINQIMDLRKQETGNLKLNLDHGEVNSFVKNITDSYDDLARQKQITFNFLPIQESIYTEFDKDKLDKIIFNILSNAFKFTPKGGEISMIIQVIDKLNSEQKEERPFSRKMIAISIEDNGRGIPEKEQEKIFERFYQIKYDNEQHEDGTGIGLSLSNDFARLHGGYITVESEVNRGSKFTIFLPFVELENKKPEDLTLPDDIDCNDISDHIDEQIKKELEASQLATILIVEDNFDLREYLVNLLSPYYHVLSASDGEEGVLIAENKIPDIIVADIMMPRLDGIEMLKVLKRNIRTNHIPIILLTAKSADIDRLSAIKKGADDYITKPFNVEILETKIKSLLDIRKSLKEKYIRHLKLDPKNIELENEDEKFLRKALSVVESNIENSEFSVETFSSEMGLSRVHLYRKLHALINESPVDFIKHIRLKRAAQLLSDSQLNVSEVCYAVGFKNPVYFAKCFKKEYKMVPSEYGESKS